MVSEEDKDRRDGWLASWKKPLLWAAVALYLAGYPMARSMHLVIHAAGYYTKGDQFFLAEHRMRAGDIGSPMLHPEAAIAVLLSNTLYLPIKPLESVFWHILHPSGAPYPYPLPGNEAPPESP